ncbi:MULTISPECIES: hypothetical protein [Hydrogenophaga]|jgi:hypothetical protein|uniref:Uncharacterized protein n=1 Tax=Hydrogenophaga intermedia TaxID=65786 RepID=A0A1L1PQ43_HYDIT|nr:MULTISPECIES: hypothetical protein [Hydrogenophaga]AOS80823.1 hypothetical protein Q5W_18570 [Hydrogenophaga sp. PBC]TMU72362.1 hypothetical protein FGJ01_19700 [Hydrogenophaga intermedia]CDN89873.1 hypothetical protein BN948_04313 [Hydrogenophaga intermedia]
MNAFADLLGRVAGLVLRLALGLAAALFLVSLLLASVLAVAGMSLWALVTGRRPAPLVVFGRLRERSRQYSQGVWRNGPASPQGAAARGEVVDVEAREVDEDPRRPQG